MICWYVFSKASSTAQNYSNNSYNRIKKGAKDTLKITVLLSLIVAVLAHFFSSEFMTLFVNKNELHIISLGVQYISLLHRFVILF